MEMAIAVYVEDVEILLTRDFIHKSSIGKSKNKRHKRLKEMW